MKNTNYNTKEGTRMVLDAIAGLYNSVHIVNLEEDRYYEVSASTLVHNCLGKEGSYSQKFHQAMKEMCHVEHLSGLLEFGSREYICENLRSSTVAVHHFLGRIHGWTEACQIVLSRDDENSPIEILFTTKIVDRRMREEMEYKEIVYALSKVYSTTVKFYLEERIFEVIELPEIMEGIIPKGKNSFDSFLPFFMENCVQEPYRDEVNAFLDFSTMPDRMKGKTSIFTEYQGVHIPWCRALIVPSRLDETGKVCEAVLAIEDISDEKRREAAYAFQADHDSLTGLLNRNAYVRYEKELAIAPCPVAYIIMDIDHFKTINDTYGHDVGDRVLKRVADLLRITFRHSDLIVRMGGDEFVVIAPNFAEQQKRMLIHRMNEMNFVLEEDEDGVPGVTLSIGIAFSKKGFTEDLFKKADIALYHKKNTGKQGWVIYDDTLANMQGNQITKVD